MVIYMHTSAIKVNVRPFKNGLVAGPFNIQQKGFHRKASVSELVASSRKGADCIQTIANNSSSAERANLPEGEPEDGGSTFNSCNRRIRAVQSGNHDLRVHMHAHMR